MLARAELALPLDGTEIFDPAVTLAWQPSEGAEGYWLEIAADAEFNVMQASEWGVRDTSRRFDGLGAGRPLLAGLLPRPARAAGRALASAGASASSTTRPRPSSP